MSGFASNNWFFSKWDRASVTTGLTGWCLALALALGIGMSPAAGADTPAEKSTPRPATVKPRLNSELAGLAKKIKEWVDQDKPNREIAIGLFRPPADVNTNNAIEKAFREELELLEVKVKLKAAYELIGSYWSPIDADSDVPVVRIKAEVINKSHIAELDLGSGDIRDQETIARLLGLTVPAPAPKPGVTPEALVKKTDEDIKRALQDKPSEPSPPTKPDQSAAPPTKPVGLRSKIPAGEGSKYAIEILAVRGESDEFNPRKVEMKDGLAFVNFNRGESYVVNLINDSEYSAAVKLFIDGLNVFEFSKNREYKHWIVPAKSSLVVPGWHLSNELSQRFEVMSLASIPAANDLKTSSNLGTITATFAAAWAVDQKAPPGEDPAKGAAELAQEMSATGKGVQVKTGFQEVRLRVGQFRGSVSLRYDKPVEPVDLPPESTVVPKGEPADKVVKSFKT